MSDWEAAWERDWDREFYCSKIADSEAPTGSDTVESQQERGQPMANEEPRRAWDGKKVSVTRLSDVALTHKLIRVDLTPEAARTIALALGRLKQTTLTLPGDAQELLTALDYVMVGDPESTRQHRTMEAGKGMTPDGGYRAPREIRGADGRSKL